MVLIERIDKLIAKGKEVLKTHKHIEGTFGFPTLDSQAFSSWQAQTISCLNASLPNGDYYRLSFIENVKDGFSGSVVLGIGILEALKEDANLGLLVTETEQKINPIDSLLKIFSKFHDIARQLRNRYDNRSTLNISDEYDVQDLLHAILKLDFDDIRPEEWTPSYAGKSSRMDFLLKSHKLFIELHKTRRGLAGKEIGSQLIEDFARYIIHPDCETLLCFVYDPEGLIGNPKGLENDLSKNEGKIKIQVFIKP